MNCKHCNHDPSKSIFQTFLNAAGFCSYCISEGYYSDESAKKKKLALEEKWRREEQEYEWRKRAEEETIEHQNWLRDREEGEFYYNNGYYPN